MVIPIVIPIATGPGMYPRPMNHRYMVQWDILKSGEYDNWRTFRTRWRSNREVKWMISGGYPARLIDTREGKENA